MEWVFGLLWRVGAPVFAAFVLFFTLQDIGPALKAAFGDSGTRGTFTAVSENCGKRACVFRGDFVSDDGAVVRRDVIMPDGPSGVGDTAVAYDTGGRSVYPEVGGTDWFFITLIIVMVVGGLAYWANDLALLLPWFLRW